MTTSTAGTRPIPKKGIAKPNSAMLGIACMMFAVCNTGACKGRRFAIRIPSGTPIKIEMLTAITVSSMCSHRSSMICGQALAM